MCRYPSASAQRTALTVVGPLGICHTPRPSTGMELPSANARDRLSAVLEPEVINVSPCFQCTASSAPPRGWLVARMIDVRSGSAQRVAAAVSEGSAAVGSAHEFLALGHADGAISPVQMAN